MKPFALQLLETDRPFSVRRTTPRPPPPEGYETHAPSDADDGPTRAQLAIWSKARTDARDRMEWEEYRQRLAGEYVCVCVCVCVCYYVSLSPYFFFTCTLTNPMSPTFTLTTLTS